MLIATATKCDFLYPRDEEYFFHVIKTEPMYTYYDLTLVTRNM